MWTLRKQLHAVLLYTVFPLPALLAQAQGSPPSAPTLRVTSSLVFLDVTVLDKSGHPVINGLNKDDFTITEDKKPQRIFSFEAPQIHVLNSSDLSNGKSPTTILVLDLLNSSFSDFAFIRYSVKKFLMTQPEQLPAPAEMMVIGNQSLEMLQGFTRNRADLLEALDHLPPALPYKAMNGFFFWDRFQQSIDALQQIALQNRGVPGRKNVIWVGHGGPNINLIGPDLTEDDIEGLKQYVHDTTNMLVDSRITLYVIYPGLKLRRDMTISMMDSDADIGDDDPFDGDINFGVFANETGGKLFFNRNDVDKMIGRSELLGSDYYTLTYQPQDEDEDGKFRRIRVTVRDRNLHVVTKAGYFAPQKHQMNDPRQQAMTNLVEAAQSTIPFKALDVHVSDIVRHPDTETAQLTVELRAKNLHWLLANNGRNSANVILAAVSLDGDRDVLASKTEGVNLSSSGPQSEGRVDQASNMKITVRVPRKTRTVRVVMETELGGRMGTAELDRKSIDAAPAEPTPEPKLINPFPPDTHRPAYVRPTPNK
jgi:VWFA-related protein